MPNPDSLRRDAQRHRQEADSLERQAHDVEQQLLSQDQTIQNLERVRQEWQTKMHQIEGQRNGSLSADQIRAIDGQVRDIENRLRDMDNQIQTARNEKDKIAH
jgi:chromosome segregation ATPase